MNFQETPLVFQCEGCRLVGIVCAPETPAVFGVVIVVGGPQYRSGSHRQFTLLARDLARQGVASMRFDYRGMGDSEGEIRTFEHVNDDVRAALDTFIAHAPSVRRVALWGLCDAAAAALYYAGEGDARVSGLVLLNPWVRSISGEQRARLKHYYRARIMDRSFWHKLFSGEMALGSRVLELLGTLRAVLMGPGRSGCSTPGEAKESAAGDYIDRMLASLRKYQGSILLVLSQNDLVAQEFKDLMETHPGWKAACASPKVEKHVLAEANHTFSSHVWRGQVSHLTSQWLARQFVEALDD